VMPLDGLGRDTRYPPWLKRGDVWWRCVRIPAYVCTLPLAAVVVAGVALMVGVPHEVVDPPFGHVMWASIALCITALAIVPGVELERLCRRHEPPIEREAAFWSRVMGVYAQALIGFIAFAMVIGVAAGAILGVGHR